jgi:hypothetical protein
MGPRPARTPSVTRLAAAGITANDRSLRNYGPVSAGDCCEHTTAAPQAHQIERGTAGKHGESHPARRGRTSTVRRGQRACRPQLIAASQADGVDVRPCAPSRSSTRLPCQRKLSHGFWSSTYCMTRPEGKQRGEVWRPDQNRGTVPTEGSHRHVPMLGPSGTVVRVRCGSAQGEGSQGEEAQDPQEALAPADINSTGRGTQARPASTHPTVW